MRILRGKGVGIGVVSVLTLLAAAAGAWSETVAAEDPNDVNFRGGFAHASWRLNQPDGTRVAADVFGLERAQSPMGERAVSVVQGVRYWPDLRQIDAITGVGGISTPPDWGMVRRTKRVASVWGAQVQHTTLSRTPDGGSVWNGQPVLARIEIDLAADGPPSGGSLKLKTGDGWHDVTAAATGEYWGNVRGEGGITLQNPVPEGGGMLGSSFVAPHTATEDGELGFAGRGHLHAGWGIPTQPF